MRKILILNNDLELGGIQKSLIEFLTYLVSSNEFSIDLMLWQKNGPLQKKLPSEVNVIFQNYPTTANSIILAKNHIQKLVLLFPFLKSLYCNRILRKPWKYYPTVPTQYDIAVSFTHTGFPPYFTIDRVLADKKFLWFHHGSYEFSPAVKSLYKQYFPRFDNIIAVSTANKLMLSDIFTDLKDKIMVVPNIINFSEIRAKAHETVTDMPQIYNEYRFVTVSRFSKEKGLDLAIEIAIKLKNNGLKFKWFFVGDGPQFPEIQQLAVDKRVADVCVFLGSRENPYPYIRHSDLYLQSTYVEAHPISISEALALKKMIVSTDIPSIREVLQSGKLGLLCKPQAELFAQEIETLLQDKSKQKMLSSTLAQYDISNEAAYKNIDNLL